MALVQAVENGKIVNDTSSTEETKAANNDLGYDQFLQLLCAEMQYQDPLEPTSNTEYVAQLATFSQMESTLNMQHTLESTSANDLVGKYVIVKSTSPTTGETTAVAGFVDYIQKENNKQYVCVNGNLYSVDDIYEVADTDYMEAVALAEAFAASLAKLPDADNLTTAWKEDLANLATVYDSLTSYQKSYIDADTLAKFKALIEKMNELTGNTSGGSGDDTTNTDNSGKDDTKTDTNT